MAPSRKKAKKPAANPARGFATTSSASKPWGATADDDSAHVEAESKKHESNARLERAPAAAVKADISAADGKELADLTPEQLEAQLVASELQLFVEKYATRTKQDAQRHVARLQTERRLLRTQAERLYLDNWISEGLIEKILNLVSSESSQARPTGVSPDPRDGIADDVVQRTWVLRRALLGLDFAEDRADEAIRQFLTGLTSLEVKDSKAARENVWGLEICLEWLAATYGSEMPNYDRHKAVKNVKSSEDGLVERGSVAPGRIYQSAAP